MNHVRSVAVLIALIFSSVVTLAEEEPKIVRVRTTVANESIQATETFVVELQVRVRSPWHINSQDPGIELLIPTTISMENPDLVELVDVVYPKATKRRFPYHNKPLPVFEGRFTVALKVKVKSSAKAGPLKLQGILRFQACSRSSCLPPEEVPFTVEVTLDSASTVDTAA